LFVAVIAGVSVAAVMLAVVVARRRRQRIVARRRAASARLLDVTVLPVPTARVSKLPVPLQRDDVAADDAGQRAADAPLDVPS
jgi:hypothetical protein